MVICCNSTKPLKSNTPHLLKWLAASPSIKTPYALAVNLYRSLAKFNRWQIDDGFLILPRKTGYDISYKLSLLETTATNVKTCLLGKIRKIFQYKSSTEILLQHA